MAVSYLTTNTLIESVKNRALIPTTQQTFTPADFLRFANEEMMMGVVPLVEQFHEEFFIFEETTPIINGQRSYEIPYRATGNKLRSIYLLDSQQNRYPLTRVFADDLEYYQGNGYGQSIYAFYIANNCVNLLNVASQDSNSRLLFSYYMRPNSLVDESRVAKVANISPSAGITFNASSGFTLGTNELVVAGHNLADGIAITLTTSLLVNPFPYPYKPNETYYVKVINGNTISLYADKALSSPIVMRNVWASSAAKIDVANSTITLDSGLYSDSIPDGSSLTISSGGSLPSPLNSFTGYYFKRVSADTYSMFYDSALTSPVILGSSGSGLFSLTMAFAGGSAKVQPNTYDITVSTTATPSVFNNSEVYDFIQSRSPHKTITYDIPCIAITGNVMRFDKESFRLSLDNYMGQPVYGLPKKGDLVALAGETIIPQVPDDLHSMLAQRIACRCLEALGDREGLAAANAKLAEMESKSAILINDRVEGSPQKVVNHNSPLRQRFIGSRITRS